MQINLSNLTNGPIKASSNMLLDKVDIVLSHRTNKALGFVTVLDINPNGKRLGKKYYWGILSANPTDLEIIDIALHGGKWKNHGLEVSFTHHYNNSYNHYYNK